VTSLASLDGRRRATGVIAVPSRIRRVVLEFGGDDALAVYAGCRPGA
jgi:hypothetical protein